MKRIIVAGAGHGGLTAAYNLAKIGYDVTVFEMKEKDELGHDWHDGLDFSAFDGSGIPRPNEDMYTMGIPQVFHNPSCTASVKIPHEGRDGFNMDRKVLIRYLADCAEKAGAKLRFGIRVLGPVTIGSKVIGIKYSENSEIRTALCDLVIDAAGVHSPVRRNLPQKCGIENDILPKDIFHVYRVYYKNTTGEILDPPYNIHLFHENRPGIDWFITEDDRVDILIGKFGIKGKLTPEEVTEGLDAFKKLYPFMGSDIIRGGAFADIPLRKMLSKIVCDGYAAVGDSAGMTIPLNGCGINLAMIAGKILADAVAEAGENELSEEMLWKYEYNYFMNLGHRLVIIDVLKQFFGVIRGKNVDFFLEADILTADQLSRGNGKGIKISKDFILHIVKTCWRVWYLFFPLVDTFKNVPVLNRVVYSMPENYNANKVRKWINKYKSL